MVRKKAIRKARKSQSVPKIRVILRVPPYKVTRVRNTAALHYLWHYRHIPKTNRWGYVRIAIGTKALKDVAAILNAIP